MTEPADLRAKLLTMGSYPHKPYPTHFINPDGPDAVKVIEGLVARIDALTEALEPFAAAYDAYVNVMRNFVVTGGTEAERRFSDGERMETAEEAAFEVLAAIEFDKLCAARAAVLGEKMG